MDTYLPIAEMSVNLFLLLGLGGAVGFLSGVFGVGGGFLMTPLLIFIGIPPAVAVGSEASQILASSFSGMFAHMRRGNGTGGRKPPRVGWPSLPISEARGAGVKYAHCHSGGNASPIWGALCWFSMADRVSAGRRSSISI